ncbi:hypothetical protein DL769_000234 [Monosporascus sp. CRB-8-3]|nr:hypothetical protein DL769_000234 [Monosporascus sp. CRB-8-3]
MIPVPRVYSSTNVSIAMDFVEGIALQEGWNELPETERSAIGAQLRDHINHMGAIGSTFVGTMDGGPAVDARMFKHRGDTFTSDGGTIF